MAGQVWGARTETNTGPRARRLCPYPHVERLVGALCAETHEEWSTGRRYLKMEEFLEWQTEQQTGKPDPEEPSEPAAVVA